MNNRKCIVFYLILLFTSGSAFGATIKGKVSDSQNGNASMHNILMVMKG